MKEPRHHRRPGRRQAVVHLLNRQQLGESVRLAPQTGVRNSALAGLQVAITTLIALPLIQLSPFSHLIGFASLGTLVALFGRFAPRARRGWIVFLCILCQTGTVFVTSLVAWLGTPFVIQILLLAVMCGLLFCLVNLGEFGPPGALIFVFAASVSMGSVDSFELVLQRTAATGSAAVLAWLICMLTEILRHRDHSGGAAPGALRSASHLGVAATRIVFGAGIAAYAAWGIGASHAGWAAMGAVAVLQGAHLHITMNRALQRTGGNLVGSVLVALLLSFEPSVWTVIVLVAVLAFATEAIIGANYGLGQILVTPMALLMMYLAEPDVAGVAMAQERVIDTLIGAFIGMVLAVQFSTQDDRAFLARHHSNRLDR
ncbi:MAG TPA: FUSC family protein [Marinobacter sp.]|nr:FUSC family protein [Marinobacter sp.]